MAEDENKKDNESKKNPRDGQDGGSGRGGDGGGKQGGRGGGKKSENDDGKENQIKK
ncbi:eukaryotic translation initiation factor 3 subunit F-like [Drosophila elegans]|uniref:eukaryotic translation initiation factor 3 subunit F-like n=1 Tax=Drosophila elegans TaxID=30023 RepID=UPI0007E75EEF|nr:eukaryotic translation initiation factor 3 subunit F-like [Drosophila elegans]